MLILGVCLYTCIAYVHAHMIICVSNVYIKIGERNRNNNVKCENYNVKLFTI